MKRKFIISTIMISLLIGISCQPTYAFDNTIVPDIEENSSIIEREVDPNVEFYRTEKEGYQLEITAAALGSREYALNKTEDGGMSWRRINSNPFNGRLGVAAGIKFMNESHGFIVLSHSGGVYADLYETKDGGKTFQEVSLPEIQVDLMGTTYNPYDFPEVPYEEDGELYLKVGQGSDGDYNGGDKALFKFKDGQWILLSTVK